MKKSVELTPEEKEELKKRGFLVKNHFTFSSLLQEINSFILKLFIFVCIGFALGISTAKDDAGGIGSLNVVYFFIIALWSYPFLLYIRTLILYTILGKVFYYQGGILTGMLDGENIRFYIEISQHFRKDIGEKYNKNKWVSNPIGLLLLIFASIVSLLIESGLDILYGKIDRFIVIATLSIILPLLSIFVLKILFNIFNSLYAFGNLGEKIQSLTPKISEQSKQIESEFRGDMDFRVLSKSFDSLASTFSQIVNLVVKLEQVEKKANKGDLFDSAKYINSLREDIRTPLLSLKTFLETKRQELRVSQEELMRVRVSVGGEGENRELQSARATELMKELDENIGKIGEMIERL